MKTKFIFLSTLFSALLIISSCEKIDDLGCDRCGDREQSVPEITNNAPCQLDSTYYFPGPAVPAGEFVCDVIWEGWFIDRATNACIEAEYSSCFGMGFASQAECKKCKPCPVLNDQHYLHFFFDEHSQVSDTLPCYTSFTSWFIDGETNQCVEYEYGHCMELGFPSFEECEKCKPVQN